MPFFKPMLAGANLRDRLGACVGAGIGIAVTSFVCYCLLHASAPLPLLVAPMGASAVLVFAVPASPLAQPWAVIGGNTVSALVGIAAALFVADTSIAAGLAVGGAVLAMSFLRYLHPPGGAAALTAVIGGPAIHAARDRLCVFSRRGERGHPDLGGMAVPPLLRAFIPALPLTGQRPSLAPLGASYP